jgi:3-oxoacyl-[acyl-carrier protein] reductase
MTRRLAGKVALVTGGSRGIGAAIARALAGAGADVAISYLTSEAKARTLMREIAASGVRAEAFKADQGDLDQVHDLVRSVIRQFGRLDILVNSAGCFVAGSIDDPDYEPEAFDRQLAVNIGGVTAAVRAAAKVLPEGGRIITIGSCMASRTGFLGVADYAATKAAVAAFCKGAARDLGSRKITVNVVQPGPVDTDMNPADGLYSADQKASTVLGRYGRPEEIAAVVAFLAGSEASFITGATIDVDGGYSA